MATHGNAGEWCISTGAGTIGEEDGVGCSHAAERRLGAVASNNKPWGSYEHRPVNMQDEHRTDPDLQRPDPETGRCLLGLDSVLVLLYSLLIVVIVCDGVLCKERHSFCKLVYFFWSVS